MDAITALKTRRSVRAYQKRPIPREILSELVDCARLAPTAFDQQAWEFVVVTQPHICQELGRIVGHAKFLLDAPACIAVLCKDHAYYVEDASAATQNILLAATAFGLGSCWVAGEKQPYADDVRKAVGAPDGYKFFALVTLGYPAESPVKDKRPLQSVLHWEKF